MKFLRIEISYDCVVIEGYRSRTKRSYAGKSKECDNNYLQLFASTLNQDCE